MLFHSRNARRWAVLAAVFLTLGTRVARAEEAPEIVLDAPAGSVRAGEAFEAAARVTWKGDSARFVLSPGALDNPTWGEAAWERVEARKTSEGVEQRFVARFTAKEPGAVSLPDLRVNYTDPTEKPVAAPPAPGADPNAPAPAPEPVLHTLKAEGASINVHADRRWLYPYLFLGVMALGLLIAFASIWYGRRKNAQAAQADALAPWETADAALHAARRHRLDGDFYKFYRELQRLVEELGGELKSEFGKKFQQRAQEVGYQGSRPTEDELESVMKDIERALARWKEGNVK